MYKFEITTDKYGDTDELVTVNEMQQIVDSFDNEDGWEFVVERSGDELRLYIYRDLLDEYDDERWTRSFTMVTDDFGYMVIGKLVKTSQKGVTIYKNKWFVDGEIVISKTRPNGTDVYPEYAKSRVKGSEFYPYSTYHGSAEWVKEANRAMANEARHNYERKS